MKYIAHATLDSDNDTESEKKDDYSEQVAFHVIILNSNFYLMLIVRFTASKFDNYLMAKSRGSDNQRSFIISSPACQRIFDL